MSSPAPVYIRVKYGDDETLLCNPSCAVVNLLNSIKTRTGQFTDLVTLDLTDEAGLIQELDVHRHDNASIYLDSSTTYVLVKKQRKRPDNEQDDDKLIDGGSLDHSEQNGRTHGRRSSVGDGSNSGPYEYVPMLNNWKQLLPGYKLRQMAVGTRAKVTAGHHGNAGEALGAGGGTTSVSGGRKKMGRQRFDRNKSPSPAGVKPTTGAAGKQSAGNSSMTSGSTKDKTPPAGGPTPLVASNGSTSKKHVEKL